MIGALRRTLYAIGAGLLVLVAGLRLVRRNDALKAKNRGLKAEDARHDRIKNADTGAFASDSERLERLRKFAAKHRN